MAHKRVLFVCVGNACRSQMAEAFSRAYGSDVLIPASAGLSPASRLPSDTLAAMREKNLDLSQSYPKRLSEDAADEFDLIVNMSGFPLPLRPRTPVREWEVGDPIVMEYEGHCKVRDQIESLVMDLILELRREGKRAALK